MTASDRRRFPLADRTGIIAPFHVMELVKRADALQALGHPMIHMSIGEPDFTAPPPVVTALEAAVRAGRTGYTHALGIAPLRHAIARHYGERFDLDVNPARVIVTAGASAGLSLACMALVNPGDAVLLTDPSYPCNRHFVAACGGEPVSIPVGPESRFQMTAPLLHHHWEAWAPDVKGVMVASPANPTGTSIPFNELAAVVDLVRSRNGFTLVDEIYLDLSYGLPGAAGERRSALTLGDDLIVVNSFSKYFSMTGWRLGWLVVPEWLVPVLEKLAQNLFICPSTLAQHAALACFSPESMAIYEDRREAFRQRRDYIVPALEAIGLPVPAKPDGAFYVYVDCSGTGLSSTEFCRRLVEEVHVSLVPGTDFGHNQPERYLRLSYATALPALQEAIGRMDAWMRAQIRR